MFAVGQRDDILRAYVIHSKMYLLLPCCHSPVAEPNSIMLLCRMPCGKMSTRMSTSSDRVPSSIRIHQMQFPLPVVSGRVPGKLWSLSTMVSGVPVSVCLVMLCDLLHVMHVKSVGSNDMLMFWCMFVLVFVQDARKVPFMPGEFSNALMFGSVLFVVVLVSMHICVTFVFTLLVLHV